VNTTENRAKVAALELREIAHGVRLSIPVIDNVPRVTRKAVEDIRDYAERIESVAEELERDGDVVPDVVPDERPRVRPGMSREELDRLVAWNRTRCRARSCEARAIAIYKTNRKNAHGGISIFKTQRCEAHPIANAIEVAPITEHGR
jgi:hypothetical protein